MANTNLNKAKKEKNDEFYTQYSDIEKEIKHYKEYLKNKLIYCNCDNPECSNFYKFFKDNFYELGLKGLYATFYSDIKKSYLTTFNGVIENKQQLNGNGDFRSLECIELLKKVDIVITNPPFSLFREYISQLLQYDKKFLIIGNQNAIKYKEIFPLIKRNEIWLGVNFGSFKFQITDKYNKDNVKVDDLGNKYTQLGNIAWYTNLDHNKRHEFLEFSQKYTMEDYPKYENYDAIEVSKVVNIPFDYDGIMGVPISFLTKYNPSQFEIIGELNHGSDNEFDFAKPIIDGIEKFPRILIRSKPNINQK